MPRRRRPSQDATETAGEVERWLQDEVAPVYDAMKANPERKLSAKSVFCEARVRYLSRSGASSRYF